LILAQSSQLVAVRDKELANVAEPVFAATHGALHDGIGAAKIPVVGREVEVHSARRAFAFNPTIVHAGSSISRTDHSADAPPPRRPAARRPEHVAGKLLGVDHAGVDPVGFVGEEVVPRHAVLAGAVPAAVCPSRPSARVTYKAQSSSEVSVIVSALSPGWQESRLAHRPALRQIVDRRFGRVLDHATSAAVLADEWPRVERHFERRRNARPMVRGRQEVLRLQVGGPAAAFKHSVDTCGIDWSPALMGLSPTS
jgi:hypothetical protein